MTTVFSYESRMSIKGKTTDTVPSFLNLKFSGRSWWHWSSA